jgi:hypothetical protein
VDASNCHERENASVSWARSGFIFQELYMNAQHISRSLVGLSLAIALTGAAGLAQAQQQQQAWGRVVSSTPITESNGGVSYNVVYEYGGHRYTAHMDSPPGARVPVQAGAYGVTTSPVAPQPQFAGNPVDDRGAPQGGGGSPWDNVIPEQGQVVSSGPGPAYGAPVYMQPAPVYEAAPVYVDPGYAWAPGYPYAYSPIGISLGLNYSRGWGGGGWGRGYGGGYRGGYGGFHGGGWHR